MVDLGTAQVNHSIILLIRNRTAQTEGRLYITGSILSVSHRYRIPLHPIQ